MDGGFMVLESIPKKKRNWIIVLALLLGLSAVWCVNAIQSRNYPFLVATAWKCNNPHFTLMYNSDENGTFTSREELEWNNEKIPVEICFLMREYDVYPVGSSAYSDRLFSGTWKYRNGDFVMIIKEDFIFGNQYKELVFSPVS